MPQLLSIIIPVYNEEKNVPFLHQKLLQVLKNDLSDFGYEIIFVNDGSKDSSWRKICEIEKNNENIKAINFSRNFGHQIALTAGYDIAAGDAIITMDADMQDPPSLLVELVAQWKEGADIVYARRIDRQDTFLKRVTANWYYILLDAVSDVRIPRNVGDFRLIDKRVLHELRKCSEKARYLRGMVAWMGFNKAFVDFKRSDRASGITGYTWKKMFTLAFDGMTAFSLFPLKIAAFVGIFVIVTGMLMFGYITFDAFINTVRYPLFKWLVTIIYIFMGVQFLLLWLIGEYIGRIFEQQKNRPLYIVQDTINI